MNDAFGSIDADADGALTLTEMRQSLSAMKVQVGEGLPLELTITDAQVTELLRRLDRGLGEGGEGGGDGRVSRGEWDRGGGVVDAAIQERAAAAMAEREALERSGGRSLSL